MVEKIPPVPELIKSKADMHHSGSPEAMVSDLMERWGRAVARRPYIFVALPLLLTAGLSAGLCRFRVNDDSQVDLYLPANPRYKQELATLEALFPMNQSSDVDFGRLTRIDTFTRIIITARDGGNMLREEYFKKIVDIDRMVNEITVRHDGKQYKYKDICLRSKKKCFINPILSIVRKIKDVQSGKFMLKYPLTVNLRAGKIYFFGLSLGGVELDENRNVRTAKAVHLVYFVRSEKKSMVSKMWDIALAKAVEDLNFPDVSASFFSQGALRGEMQRSFRDLTPLLAYSAVAMGILGACCGLARDWTRSKVLVGLAGLSASIMASISALGLCSLFGFQFVAACGSVVLVIVATGFLDTLVLVSAWRATPGEDVESRLGAACRSCGSWPLLRPLALTAAGLGGALYPTFPLLASLGTFVLAAAPLAGLYQMCLVVGALALAGRLERNGRHHLTCQPTSIVSGNVLQRWLCLGGGEAPYRHWLMSACRATLEAVSTRAVWKLTVLAGFVAYLTGGCYGLSQLVEGLDRRTLTGYGTPLETFFNLEMKYFRKYPVRIQIIVNHTMDYSKPEVQQEMDEMLKRFEGLPNVMDSSLTESWLRLYLSFLNHRVSENMMDGYNLTDKYDFYRGLREVFFRLPLVSGLKRDVIFNEDYTEIVASRFLVHTHDLFTSKDERDLILQLRQLADSLPYPTTVYNLFFDVFEMHATVSKIPMIVTAALSCILFVVMLVFTCDFKTSTLSVLSLFSVQIAVIGFSGLWNIEMDAISSTAFSTYVAFSVFLVSIVPFFFSKFKHEPHEEDRFPKALLLTGSSVVMFFITMVASSIALFFSSTGMFVNQQKIFLLYIVFSTFQGLLIPPVLLNGLNVNHNKTLKISEISKPKEISQIKL